MPDREKVIKDLEFCVNGHYKVELSLATKILALLKEQEQEIQFLKAMQLQTVNYMNEEDLGTAVAKSLGLRLKGR